MPVDGFWSNSLYNADGYYRKEHRTNAYSLNNITSKKNADGSVTIQFGGCDGKVPNCLPTDPGRDSNYTVRLYRAHAQFWKEAGKVSGAPASGRLIGRWSCASAPKAP